MRRARHQRWLILAAWFVAIGWLTIPFTLQHATPTSTRIRPEDPATVPADADPAAIFEQHQAAVSRLLSLQFGEGRRLIGQLYQAELPVEIRSLVTELNKQLIEQSGVLETADALFREVSALNAAGKTDAARKLLAQFDGLARRGRLLLDYAAQGFQDIAHQSNVDALPPDAPQRRAYEDLRRVAARVQALMLAYQAAVQDPKSVKALAQLLPYQTRIDLSVPPLVYPGRAFMVQGAAIEDARSASRGRVVSLLLDDQVLAEVPLGHFRRELILPQGTLPGTHRFTATVRPQGRYLGAIAQRSTRVGLAVPVVQVSWPKYAVAPGRLLLSGTATSEFGSLAGALVQVRIGETVREATTSAAGDFHLMFDLPTRLTLLGPQTAFMEIVPKEAWHATTSIQRTVLIVNLVNVGFVALLIPAAGIAYGVSRRRKSPELPQIDLTRPEVPLAPQGLELAGTLLEGSVQEQVLALYLGAVRHVQVTTGLRIQPSNTMREFAQNVRGKLSTETFTRMTELAEVTLYSRHSITQSLVEAAQLLRTQLERELADVVS